MKITRILVRAVSVCTLCFVVAALAGADQANQKKTEAKGAHLHKASVLKGLAVKNEKGEDLGRVVDMVLNITDGRIAYAAIGFGDKFFAVPLGAMRIETIKDRPNEKHFVLNMDRGEFENNPGFNKNNWPPTADPRFQKGANVEVGKVRVSADYGGVEVTVGARGKEADKAHVRRITALTGMAVKSPTGESLATIRDFMIDVKEQHVVFVAVGHGGVLGVNEKLFAVPWDAMEVRSLTAKAADEAFILNVDKTVFDTNPGFDKDNWPTDGDRKLFQKITRPEA